jgi:hypothetical protein
MSLAHGERESALQINCTFNNSRRVHDSDSFRIFILGWFVIGFLRPLRPKESRSFLADLLSFALSELLKVSSCSLGGQYLFYVLDLNNV